MQNTITSTTVRRLSIHLAILLAMPLSAVHAQCADQGTTRIDSRFRVGPIQSCGSGLRLRVRGLEFESKSGSCPTFVVYEPPHDGPVTKRGYYTTIANAVPVEIFYYRCTKRYLFGFIPVGSHCAPSDSKSVAALFNRVQHGCDKRER